MDSLDDFAGSASGIAVGAYLIAVVYHGNTKALGKALYNEEGYVEFVIALLILGFLDNYGPTSKVATALTAAAIIGMLIKVSAKNGLTTELAKFASGQQSALVTIKSLLSGS